MFDWPGYGRLLGQEVSQGMRVPLLDGVEKVKNAPRLTTKKGIRSFLD